MTLQIIELRGSFVVFARLLWMLVAVTALASCGGGQDIIEPENPEASPSPVYDVSLLINGNGSLSATTSLQVTRGESINFSVAADSGWEVSDVSGCNGNLNSATYTISSVQSNCTVTATFTPLVEHLVSFDIGENGTVALLNELVSDPQLVVSGEVISLVVAPNDGYAIESVAGCTGSVNGLVYETAAITEDCTITATFKVTTEFTVVPISSKGGSIFPNETQIVIENDTIGFEIHNNEDEDYVLLGVSGCGGELTGTTYTTAPINEHCYVVVEFFQRSLLHDTGITTCGSYDETRRGSLSIYLDNLDCEMQPIPSTALQAGLDVNGNIVPAGQDAHFGRDAVDSASLLPKTGAGAAGFDFTKLNNDGTEYSGSGDYEIDPWTCVRDNHTGLIWEAKEAVNSIYNESERDGDDLYVWHSADASRNGVYDAAENYVDRFFPWCHASIGDTRTKACFTSNYVERANRDNLCGIDSWRLPSVNELHGLVHYGASQSNTLPGPLIDTDYFPNINIDFPYFTRMAANDYPVSTQESVWVVAFNRAYSSVGTRGIGQRGAAMLVSQKDSSSGPDDTETFEMKIEEAKSYSIFRNDFLPIAKHEKCINCHEFEVYNEVGYRSDIYRRHIQEGRITPSYRDSDCVACHTEATGFVDDWRAPLPGTNDTNFLTSRATPDVICQAMNRVRDPAHHLLEDHLILWAVEQFPDITKQQWTELVESMIVEGTENVFSCNQP